MFFVLQVSVNDDGINCRALNAASSVCRRAAGRTWVTERELRLRGIVDVITKCQRSPPVIKQYYSATMITISETVRRLHCAMKWGLSYFLHCDDD